ncbi:MAG: HAMP domain-containing histidine kinase [Deltaproteobacteria bacterium]|nr:HAMP domain-containing histidine kinase [Deltaproteobacteria bacterium]
MQTFFAPAERTKEKELTFEIETVRESSIISGLLHSVGGLLAILDERRQILAVNDSFLQKLGISDADKVLGLRPGEALRCIHAEEEPHGCGTTKYCSTCGAAIAIVTSLKDNQATERICALSAERGNENVDLALLVRSHPIIIENRRFLLLFLQDVTKQEQRAALERTFFHDINNVLSSLLGATELLREEYQQSELVNIVYQSALCLQREIAIQQCLVKNECAIYEPFWQELNVGKILHNVESFFKQHAAAHNKELNLHFDDTDFLIDSDHSLVMRVLCNMVTNALEASPKNGVVDIWAEDKASTAVFCVHNQQVIPENVALRIFQRNFSTKGEEGRGVGTFSMKLFGEKILKGKVTFSTAADTGTTFRLALPVRRVT